MCWCFVYFHFSNTNPGKKCWPGWNTYSTRKIIYLIEFNESCTAVWQCTMCSIFWSDTHLLLVQQNLTESCVVLRCVMLLSISYISTYHIQDAAWLKIINALRKREGSSVVSNDTFEFIMDRFEKEAHFQVYNKPLVPSYQTPMLWHVLINVTLDRSLASHLLTNYNSFYTICVCNSI